MCMHVLHPRSTGKSCVGNSSHTSPRLFRIPLLTGNLDTKELENKIEELIELLKQLEKLLIQLISVVGWLLILIKLFH